MNQKIAELYIFVGFNGDTDKEEIDSLTRQLSYELRQVDYIQSVKSVMKEDLPVGAKGTPIDFGALLLKIAEVEGLSSVAGVVTSWLSRDKSRTLKLQIGDKSLEVTGLSKVEQQDLIQWFKSQSSYNWTAKI